MIAEPVLSLEPLGPRHDVARFDCGVPSLNDYLAKRALSDQHAEQIRVYLVALQDQVVGYFSRAAGAVEPQDATERMSKGQGAQPIPVILLGRLAVDVEYQGNGLGEALLVEALARSAAAAGTIGARVMLVHAIDERAREFYLKYGFEFSPTDPLHLVMLMKDIRRTFRYP